MQTFAEISKKCVQYSKDVDEFIIHDETCIHG